MHVKSFKDAELIRGKTKLCGVEAVIAEDYTACFLACELLADAMLLLTDVDGVYLCW